MSLVICDCLDNECSCIDNCIDDNTIEIYDNYIISKLYIINKLENIKQLYDKNCVISNFTGFELEIINELFNNYPFSRTKRMSILFDIITLLYDIFEYTTEEHTLPKTFDELNNIDKTMELWKKNLLLLINKNDNNKFLFYLVFSILLCLRNLVDRQYNYVLLQVEFGKININDF